MWGCLSPRSYARLVLVSAVGPVAAWGVDDAVGLLLARDLPRAVLDAAGEVVPSWQEKKKRERDVPNANAGVAKGGWGSSTYVHRFLLLQFLTAQVVQAPLLWQNAHVFVILSCFLMASIEKPSRLASNSKVKSCTMSLSA